MATPTTEPTEPADPGLAQHQFLLDGKAVDEASYEAFKASLSNVPGTDFCEETVEGGTSGSLAVDAQGTTYEVLESVEPTGDVSSITRKTPPAPVDGEG